MRRAFALILAALFICVVFAGCGDDDKKSRDKDFDEQTKDYEGMIVTEVKMDYTVELADEFAESAEPDFEKDIVKYAFEEDKYDEFLSQLKAIVRDEVEQEIDIVCQYTHINLIDDSDDTYGFTLGVDEDEYLSEDEYFEFAQRIGQVAIKYQLNTENPNTTFPVYIKNASNGDLIYSYTYENE